MRCVPLIYDSGRCSLWYSVMLIITVHVCVMQLHNTGNCGACMFCNCIIPMIKAHAYYTDDRSACVWHNYCVMPMIVIYVCVRCSCIILMTVMHSCDIINWARVWCGCIMPMIEVPVYKQLRYVKNCNCDACILRNFYPSLYVQLGREQK